MNDDIDDDLKEIEQVMMMVMVANDDVHGDE